MLLFIFASFQCKDEPSVKLHYLGHSSFLIFFDNEISVLTDYGKPNAYLEYGWDSPIYDIGNFMPTIITYSHIHDDHFDSARIRQDLCPIIKCADSIILKELSIFPVLSSEDNLSKKDNCSYVFNYKGITILHAGDCQANIIHIDSIENWQYVKDYFPKDCDVALIPIEGKSKFIPQAEAFIELIHPKMVIPMHYWSESYKQEFLKYMEQMTGINNKKYKIISLKNTEYQYLKQLNNDTIYILDIQRSKYPIN